VFRLKLNPNYSGHITLWPVKKLAELANEPLVCARVEKGTTEADKIIVSYHLLALSIPLEDV
jgi:hypothetical protein